MSDTAGAGSSRLLLALVATTGIGLLGSNTMPLFVGSLIAGFGIDEATIGLLASLELSGVALGALAVAPWAARMSRRTSGLVGLAIAAAGYLVTAGATNLVLFGSARLELKWPNFRPKRHHRTPFAGTVLPILRVF